MRLSVQIEFDKTLDLVTAKTQVTVGRSPQCDLVIPHDSVSRTHCRIELNKGVFTITDLGSSNGTFIDGERLSPEEKSPYLINSHLVIGKLDCELSESGKIENPENAAPVTSNGSYTAVTRVSRLDLNKNVRPSENTLLKVKGPRNPVSESKRRSAPKKEGKKFYIFLFILVSLGIAWLYSEGTK